MAQSKRSAVLQPVAETVKKPAVESIGKPAQKALVKVAPKPAKEASKTAAVKAPTSNAASAAAKSPATAPAKTKNKLVRDSFTIPKTEYTVLEGLKLRAANLKRPVKKSELLRAGIGALNRMNDRAFLASLGEVPSLKTGRPGRE